MSAVLYFRVIDPSRAVTEVRDYLYATLQISQTTLRSVGGQTELDDLLGQREKVNTKIQEIIDLQTEPWGIKVKLVELKNIDLPQDMQRAIAAQAEAERERRAKVIAAEGEFQAAQRLAAGGGRETAGEIGLVFLRSCLLTSHLRTSEATRWRGSLCGTGSLPELAILRKKVAAESQSHPRERSGQRRQRRSIDPGGTFLTAEHGLRLDVAQDSQ